MHLTEDPSPTVTGAGLLSAGHSSDVMVVALRDQGDHMEPAAVERYFEPFYRRESHEHGLGGAGLGLAVCNRLVSAMGGSVRAQPNPAGGLQVSFTLPLVDVAD